MTREKPDSEMLDAVELYHVMIRVVALREVYSERVTEIVAGWVESTTFGADEFEKRLMLKLLRGDDR